MGHPGVRIHGHPISTWVRTVRMTCIEKDIDHELVRIAYGSAEHRALHPFGRIPIVEIGETVIFETLAISGHLDEAFPGAALQPEGHAARARMRTWMGLCADYLYRDVVRAIPRDRSPTDEELMNARSALQHAEALVPGDGFLAGEAVTLADLYLAPQLDNCAGKAPELLDGLPAIAAWMELMRARPSFRRTVYVPA
jgi:glutathione S-transferase